METVTRIIVTMPGWCNGSTPGLLLGSWVRFLILAPRRTCGLSSPFCYRRCPTVLPPELISGLAAFLLLLTELFRIIIGILFPATPTALSVISDFGVLGALLYAGISTVKKFTNW